MFIVILYILVDFKNSGCIFLVCSKLICEMKLIRLLWFTVHHDPTFDQFDFLHMMKGAHIKAFTAPKIVPGFNEIDIFPVDATTEISAFCPKSFNDATNMCTPKNIAKMVEKNLKSNLAKPASASRGQNSTKKALLATSEEAIKAIRQKH